MPGWGSFEGQRIARLRRHGHHMLADTIQEALSQSTHGAKITPKPVAHVTGNFESEPVMQGDDIQTGFAVGSRSFEDPSFRSDSST